MFDFFSQMLGYVEVAFDYLVNLIESLLMAVGFLTSAAGFTTGLISYMPPIIGTAIVVFVAIFLIKFLIGR